MVHIFYIYKAVKKIKDMHENDYFKYYFINALSFIKLRENNIGSIKRSQLNEISLIGIS